MGLYAEVGSVETRDDLAMFISRLKADLESNQKDWENPTLERFLEAMEAWVGSMDSYAKNMEDKECLNPSWRTFAKILLVSSIYE
jgi:hypothetical protein